MSTSRCLRSELMTLTNTTDLSEKLTRVRVTVRGFSVATHHFFKRWFTAKRAKQELKKWYEWLASHVLGCVPSSIVFSVDISIGT